MNERRSDSSATSLDGRVSNLVIIFRCSLFSIILLILVFWSSSFNLQLLFSTSDLLFDQVYIAGGFNGQECLFTAEFFDPNSAVWTRITPMRSRRSGVSIISFHGLVSDIISLHLTTNLPSWEGLRSWWFRWRKSSSTRRSLLSNHKHLA